jgi:hypothetical protein
MSTTNETSAATKLGTTAGALIALGFLYLLFYSAAEHSSLSIFATPLFGVILSYAVIGMLLGAAAIVTSRLVQEPVVNWIQTGIGLAVLSVLIAVSWASFVVALPGLAANEVARAMAQLSQVFQGQNVSLGGTSPSVTFAGFMPIELFVLFGVNNGTWTFSVSLLLISIASVAARRYFPGNVLIKAIGGGVAGVAVVGLLVQVLIWLAQPGTAVWTLFGAGDASAVVSTVFVVLVQLAVLGILIISLTGLLSSSTDVIAGCAQWAAGLAWGLIWLAIGSDLIHFVLSLDNGQVGVSILAFVTGMVAGIVPLGAAGLLVVYGARQTLINIAARSGVQTSPVLGATIPPVPSASRPAFPPPPPPISFAVGPPVPPPAGGSATSPLTEKGATVEEQLLNYKKWHEQGLISEEEYRNLKIRLLS